MAIEVGSRWLYRGRVLTVVEVAETLFGRGAGPWACAVPERTKEQRRVCGLRPADTHHWTDWFTLTTFENVATPLLDGEEAPEPERAPTHREVAEAEVKKRSPMTPRKRLRNRISSARYKLKHPEKNGRTSWNALEIRDIQETIQQAEAELEALATEQKEEAA